MQNQKTHPHALRRAAAILLALTCLCAAAPARAQDLPNALKSDRSLSPINKKTYEDAANAYVTAYGNRASNMEAALQARNNLIDMTVAQIDFNFNNYQKKTRKHRAIFETLLDILEIGASTAISITNGERAKSLIAEGLGALQLSRASINKNFSLKETQILFNKMVSKRAQMLGNILTKQGQDVNQYSWETALIDLMSYYHAGTIDGALENLNIDTGEEAAEATRAVESLKIVTPEQRQQSQSYRELLRELFNKAKAGDANALNKLRDALKQNADIDPTLIKADDVDKMDVNALQNLYKQVGLRLLQAPEKLQKLADALKP